MKVNKGYPRGVHATINSGYSVGWANLTFVEGQGTKRSRPLLKIATSKSEAWNFAPFIVDLRDRGHGRLDKSRPSECDVLLDVYIKAIF